MLVGFGLLAGMLKEALRLPDWLVDASPFEHVPMLPTESWVLSSMFVLLSFGALLVMAGGAMYSRRDAT